MRPAKNHRLGQSDNRRTGPVMSAVFILLAVAIGFIAYLPTFAQEDTKAIGAVQVASSQPGVLDVSWDAPTDTPRDYRINWARVGENFPTWTDSSGNAFPTSPSYTITGLDQGVRYKVRVRARSDGLPGAWSRLTPFPISVTNEVSDSATIGEIIMSETEFQPTADAVIVERDVTRNQKDPEGLVCFSLRNLSDETGSVFVVVRVVPPENTVEGVIEEARRELFARVSLLAEHLNPQTTGQ